MKKHLPIALLILALFASTAQAAYKLNPHTNKLDYYESATGAPTSGDYLVGTANAGLSAEIVVGTSPGGELGGTWASPTIDDGISIADIILTGSANIPNGTAPTVDAAGEIAEDTTVAGQLIVGASADVLTPIRVVSIPLESPSDAQNILLGKLPYGIVIQSITCGCDPADTGESVVIDVQERDATGDTPASADATITCDNDGAADDGALSNATFDSGDWWSLDIGTVTGTVSNAFVTIKYKVVRE